MPAFTRCHYPQSSIAHFAKQKRVRLRRNDIFRTRQLPSPFPFPSFPRLHHNKIRSQFIKLPTPPKQSPNKTSRAPSYPTSTPPFVQESIHTQRTSSIQFNLNQPVQFFPVNPTSPQSPCLPSWRKFLTPSTTLLPLLATPQSPISLPTPPPPATSLLRTMQFWPALQRVADSISVTSHTRRPRGSCKPSSRDT